MALPGIEPHSSPPAAGATRSFRIVAYNFLAGGSRKRTGHWSRVIRGLGADVVLAQECRPPEESPGERYRPRTDDSLTWQPARSPRWGSAVLTRAARLTPIPFPDYAGWIVGGALDGLPGSSQRPVRVFSLHCPAGERGYVRTMHEILDRLAPLAESADVILGGDLNVAAGYRLPTEKRTISRGEREILDRLARDFDLSSCWQAANPGRPLAQTLRWSANRKEPYHCDGIFAPTAWRARLISCRVVRGSRWSTLSDHNPVVAEFAAPQS